MKSTRQQGKKDRLLNREMNCNCASGQELYRKAILSQLLPQLNELIISYAILFQLHFYK